MGRGREKWRVESRSEKRKSQKKEDADARKGRKVAKHCAFPMIWGPGGSKSRLAKAAGVEPSGQMRDEKLDAVVARSTFRSQNVQNTPGSDHFGSWDVEKVHAVVARSTFRSQNVQSTPGPDHFWKFRCWKSARRCGTKHISKSKRTKHTRSGPLLEVEMLKKCTPLWREANFEVKMLKAPGVRTTFGSWDVEKVHAVLARSTFRSQNVQDTTCSRHFWKLRCWKSACRCGAKHISKSKCTKHHMSAPLLDIQMSFRVAGTRDYALSQEWAKREGFVAFPKTMAGVTHLKRICKDAFRLAGALQRTCLSEMLGGQGADFLRGVAFWSMRFVALLRWFCVTGAALCMTWHHFFRGRRCALDRWSGKIAKRVGTRPSTLHSTFHFSRKSRRIALFLMLSTLKTEEISQNCFVFDVVKFKNWGSLPEVLRFQYCR